MTKISDERLKELKDSIGLQKDVMNAYGQDMLLVNEEEELYNEVIRLKEENKKYEIDYNALKETNNTLEDANKELLRRLSKAAELVRKYSYSVTSTKGKKQEKIHKMELVDIELSNLLELLDGTRYDK